MTSRDSWNKRINLMTLSRLEERFSVLYSQGKYEEADEVLGKTLFVAKATFGADHAYVTACQNNRRVVRKKLEEARRDAVEKNSDTITFKSTAWFGKVSRLTAVIAALVFLLTTAFVYGAINLRADDFRQNNAAVLTRTTYPLYKIKAAFSPEDMTVAGEEEVFFIKGTETELYFNLYFNRYSDPAAGRSEMRKYAYQTAIDQGYIDILAVTYQNRPLSFKEENNVLKVLTEKNMDFSGQDGLKITFKVKIPAIADRSGLNEKGVWLGNWLPTLTAKRDAHPFTEIGDAFVNVSSTYQISMFVPEGHQVVLSNLEEPVSNGKGVLYQGTIEHVRDLPLFINIGYEKVSVMEGETEISYYYHSKEARPIEVAAMAKRALNFYNSYVGTYPWKQLNLVENDMYLSGMEYSTLILLSTKAMRSSMEETIFHEIGHQWFYNIVGSDQYRGAFIDEGLVEFLGYYVLKRQVPQNMEKTWGLHQDLGQFRTWKQYREVHYRNGRKVFENLYLILGKTEFENFIKEYYDKYKYALVTPEEFKNFVSRKIGSQKAAELLGY